MNARKLKFLVGGLVVVTTMAVLMAVSFQGNMAYYVEVSDYLSARPGELQGNHRIKGTVVEGSIVKTPGELGAAFEMTDGTHTMKVSYHKELPDTFVNEAEVVVEGEMGPDQVFVAHTLLAKCPSKYEAETEYPAADPA
jgi:cytochrome c-type biogenesis protein CcmE